jgi:hypothetical protein
MRNWYDFILKKEKEDNLNRLSYTNAILLKSKDFKKYFQRKFFKKLEHSYTSYVYFKKNLNKKERIFFIGSGWGYLEYFLSDSYKVIASDYNKKYVDYFKKKKKKNFRYLKYNILSSKQNFKNIRFNQIVINNIEYLFNNKQMEISLKNLKKLGNKNTNFFYIFRSRDSFVIKVIDKYLAYLEVRIIQFIKIMFGKNYNFSRNHHGFRRHKNEFLNFFNNNDFKIISVYENMYQTEYNRLRIVRKLKLGKILSILFLKSHPYLNIIKFKFKG